MYGDYETRANCKRASTNVEVFYIRVDQYNSEQAERHLEGQANCPNRLRLSIACYTILPAKIAYEKGYRASVVHESTEDDEATHHAFHINIAIVSISFTHLERKLFLFVLEVLADIDLENWVPTIAYHIVKYPKCSLNEVSSRETRCYVVENSNCSH